MSYYIYDSNGYVGDLCSNNGLNELKKAVGDKKPFDGLWDDGSIDISDDFIDSVSGLLDSDETVKNFKSLVKKCADVVIITNGIFEEEIEQESYKGGEGSGNFGHEGRPGEVGGSGEGGGGGGKPAAEKPQPSGGGSRQAFILDKVKVTGRSESDKNALPKFQKEIESANIPDSHLDTVKSIEINTAKVNAKGGMTVAYVDGSGNMVFNGKVGHESVVHEIGHAYFQKKIYVRGNDDKYKILDAFSASQKTGKGFVSWRSKADPDEYFAESYAAYAKDSKSFTKLNPTMGKLLGKYWK